MTAKILVIAGSTRPGSFNAKLAECAARSIAVQGAEATRIDLGHYPLPIYEAELEAVAIPENVHALHALFSSHDGVFIASPEYNSFPAPLLLNMLDWLSRVRHYEGGMVEAFERPAFAIGSASPSPLGGYRGLTALRHKLELGLGATVMPAMASVMAAYAGFDDDGNIIDERNAAMLEKGIGQLLVAAVRK